MNIGEAQRIIEIDPVVVPVPEVMPDPVPSSDTDPVTYQLEPVGQRSGP